jgi:hypothetical protein
LVAAAEAARGGARVVLLEKNQKPGLKVLISGGGHCNVATTLGPREAEPLFGQRGGRFLRRALHATPPQVIRGWLEERGVATVEAEWDKVWPKSMRAGDVLNALVGRAVDAGVELTTCAPVTGIWSAGDRWRVSTDATEVSAAAVILACGGSSYPKTGTVGEGFAWLRALGLEIIAPVPALAPLRSPAAWVRDLAGVTLPDAEIQLRVGERIVYRRRRPVLFTHRGISGPGPMDCASRLEKHPGRFSVHVSFCPDASEGEVAALFAGGGTLSERVRDFGLPRRLTAGLLERLGLANMPPAQVSADARRDLVAGVTGLEIPISGTEGFARAEVTAGGVALHEVDAKTMCLRRFPGLYVTGELLDVDGPIGGFSFWVAFATGVLAGRASAVS